MPRKWSNHAERVMDFNSVFVALATMILLAVTSVHQGDGA
jgi:hypothetical protein